MPSDLRLGQLRGYFSTRQIAYHIETYGCQMNVRDSEELCAALEELGCVRAQSSETAGLIIFNTCCVRDHAEARVRGNVGALRERKETNPELIIGVCGCMMQQKGAAEKFSRRYPFVDFMFGTHNLANFQEILAEAVLTKKSVVAVEEEGRGARANKPLRRSSGLHAFVTIMHGCDNFCSYCIVPYVRGREQSRPMDAILSEIAALAQGGTAAITLLGQNVNSFKGEHGKDSFAKLLDEIGNINGIKRVGFMTSHPKDVPDSLLRSIADGAHMNKHIHLPVQSGSDAVLAAMNRGYTRDAYLALLGRIRQIPGVEVTTDIIVGFPGETERDFQDTLDLVEKASFASAFTFQYSPRTGTKAAEMPNQLGEDVKKERLLRLNALQDEITQKNSAAYVGQVVDVFVESIENEKYIGKTASQKSVTFTREVATPQTENSDPGNLIELGDIVSVKITQAKRSAIVGTASLPGSGIPESGKPDPGNRTSVIPEPGNPDPGNRTEVF